MNYQNQGTWTGKVINRYFHVGEGQEFHDFCRITHMLPFVCCECSLFIVQISMEFIASNSVDHKELSRFAIPSVSSTIAYVPFWYTMYKWPIPSPQRSLGHSLLKQKFSQKFIIIIIIIILSKFQN